MSRTRLRQGTEASSSWAGGPDDDPRRTSAGGTRGLPRRSIAWDRSSRSASRRLRSAAFAITLESSSVRSREEVPTSRPSGVTRTLRQACRRACGKHVAGSRGSAAKSRRRSHARSSSTTAYSPMGRAECRCWLRLSPESSQPRAYPYLACCTNSRIRLGAGAGEERCKPSAIAPCYPQSYDIATRSWSLPSGALPGSRPAAGFHVDRSYLFPSSRICHLLERRRSPRRIPCLSGCSASRGLTWT